MTALTAAATRSKAACRRHGVESPRSGGAGVQRCSSATHTVRQDCASIGPMLERLAYVIYVLSNLAVGLLVICAAAIFLLGSGETAIVVSVVFLVGALAVHIVSRFVVWLLAGG